MKKAFGKWYVYLIAFGLVILAGLVGVVPYFGLNNPDIWPKVYISYICLFSAVIYIGGGFIAQDIYRGVIRKRTNNWDFPLEDNYLETAWKIYLPLLLAGAVLLIGGLISYLFLK